MHKASCSKSIRWLEPNTEGCQYRILDLNNLNPHTWHHSYHNPSMQGVMSKATKIIESSRPTCAHLTSKSKAQCWAMSLRCQAVKWLARDGPHVGGSNEQSSLTPCTQGQVPIQAQAPGSTTRIYSLRHRCNPQACQTG